MVRDKLPRLSRIDFYRLKGDELISALSNAIATDTDRNPAAKLRPEHAAIFAWARMSADVLNGGFTQFFYNHRGDWGVIELANLLDSIGMPKAGGLIRIAHAVFRQHQPAFAVANPWEGLFGSFQEFEKLDAAFGHIVPRCERALEKWIRSNITTLATDELGNPIDSQFTGSVETMQTNGLVSHYLEVKKGKPNGAYREFFNDGTVRSVVFYKSGKVSGDFWPDGQLKRKEFKRGAGTIIEWFYPSGKLLKRFVKDKSGHAVEPVRLFHENGQLAEELTVVKCETGTSDEKHGPWLKFFNDASPKLKAEYTAGQTLIVHDAWNDDRVQVVKDGTGIFYDDGRSIDWQYSVFFDSRWQYETELKFGIPHGKVTKYHDGVVWSVSSYVDGIEDGTSTLYWNNGRVRSITTFVQGKKGESRSFPKFDQPIPAVVLSVEANEKLYTAWQHKEVDEYPLVLNLDEIQRQLKVPDFVREVHERNLAGTLTCEYEDCNTFKDSIAYFLTVNESGDVTRAMPNGSGAYSGGTWNTYPPLLGNLRFTPGRIRGHAVECRVLARVDHTFVEGRTD